MIEHQPSNLRNTTENLGSPNPWVSTPKIAKIIAFSPFPPQISNPQTKTITPFQTSPKLASPQTPSPKIEKVALPPAPPLPKSSRLSKFIELDSLAEEEKVGLKALIEEPKPIPTAKEEKGGKEDAKEKEKEKERPLVKPTLSLEKKNFKHLEIVIPGSSSSSNSKSRTTITTTTSHQTVEIRKPNVLRKERPVSKIIEKPREKEGKRLEVKIEVKEEKKSEEEEKEEEKEKEKEGDITVPEKAFTSFKTRKERISKLPDLIGLGELLGLIKEVEGEGEN